MVLNLLRKITNKIMDKLKNKKNKNYKKKDKLQNQNLNLNQNNKTNQILKTIKNPLNFYNFSSKMFLRS
jgi:hypothetical protein